jgi:hypothetical protein
MCLLWFLIFIELMKYCKIERPLKCILFSIFYNCANGIQGVIESCTDILTSYWLHVELGKNI